MSHQELQVQPRKRCGSHVTQTIYAPISLVWSVVRKFDEPQAYKKLIKTCTLVSGSGEVGSIRQVMFKSGIPGKISLEKLEKVDEKRYVIVYRVIDGDHKLVNFHVTTMLYEEVAENGNGNGNGNGNENRNRNGKKTVVIESYTVDVPEDSNEEDTCYFANHIIELNLKNLAILVERMDLSNKG